MEKEEDVNKNDNEQNIDKNDNKENTNIKDNEKKTNINDNEEIKVQIKDITIKEDELDKESHHRRKENDKSKNKIKHIIIIISIIITIICVIVLYMLVIKLETNIFKNVYVLNENVSGYSEEELEEYLIKKSDEFNEVNLELYHNDKKIFTVYSSNIDLEIDIDETLKNAFKYGRESNDFNNALTIIKNLNKNININVEYKYSQEKLEELIKNVDLSLEKRYTNDTFTIDNINNNLILIKGTKGDTIDYDTLSKEILESITTNEIRREITVIQKESGKISADELYKKTNIEPVDAYINEKDKKVVKEIMGYKLSKDKINEALNKLNEKNDKEEIIMPLEVIEAKIKSKDLHFSHFNDKIEGVTTYFNSADKNRSRNIQVGVKYINEKIIMPGEIFSFNNTVGEITRAKGYLEATTFSGGKAVKGIGGGICQVSSTLYNVALKSNLEIVTRYAHSLPVGYVLPSLDATIYVGVQDFKFKNTREYPIKIVALYNSAGSLNISMYGVKEDKEYDITLESKKIQTIYAKTKYIYDNNLEKGKEQVIYRGSNGVISQSYIVKSLNGKVVSRQLLSKDTYGAQDKIIKVGIKEDKVNIY